MAVLDEAAEILGSESEAKVSVADGRFTDLRKDLAKQLKKGEAYYTLKNGTGKLFHTDWSLNLIPEDLKAQTERYFEEKYVQFAGEKFIPGVSFIVVRTQDRRTVNLLESFLIEKQIPSLMPLPVGKEVVVKSQFVIGAGETILVSEAQRDDLQRYIKWRRQWTDDEGKTRESDWLGFLIAKEVSLDNVKAIEFDRPVLSFEDLGLAPSSVEPEMIDRKAERHGQVVYATE